jgi:hypothetical protein
MADSKTKFLRVENWKTKVAQPCLLPAPAYRHVPPFDNVIIHLGYIEHFLPPLPGMARRIRERRRPLSKSQLERARSRQYIRNFLQKPK